MFLFLGVGAECTGTDRGGGGGGRSLICLIITRLIGRMENQRSKTNGGIGVRSSDDNGMMMAMMMAMATANWRTGTGSGTGTGWLSFSIVPWGRFSHGLVSVVTVLC